MAATGPDHQKLPKALELAIKYTDESSKRIRWIVFILQLAVVLVTASLWQSNHLNWAKLRLTETQNAIKLLTCEPSKFYAPDPGPLRDAISKLKPELNPGQPTLEELNAGCTVPLSESERQQARAYVKRTGYNVEQLKSSLVNRQQLFSPRMFNLGVPVLGITFDINDLSVVAAITFSILLSWLYFMLQSQRNNVATVFSIARQSGTLEELRLAYDLLTMTQVVTIVPRQDPGRRNVSLLRLWSRLPNLIMWTAVLAQASVLYDDLTTMSEGNITDPSHLINDTETAIAAYLFGYIFYRTFKCSSLMMDAYCEWATAFNQFSPESLVDIPAKSKILVWLRQHCEWTAWFVLLVGALVHVVDESGGNLRWLKNPMHYLSPILLIMILVIGGVYWFSQDPRRTERVVMVFSGLALLDVVLHYIALRWTEIGSAAEFFNGIYTAPLLIITSIILIVLLKRSIRASQQTKHPSEVRMERAQLPGKA